MNDRSVPLFRALADPTRLRLLRLLGRGELCVCDLMAILRLPQARTSRHLGTLKKAGLVKSRKDGLWSYYSLTRPRDAVHRKLLECVRAIPAAEALKGVGRCCPR
jgi:ArsR family transcriptional regulator, arsenate/arsenite/antimonite-responsive transcriptional repressor